MTRKQIGRLQRAIQNGYHFYWIYNGENDFELRVTGWVSENGISRSRRFAQCSDRETALAIQERLVEYKASIGNHPASAFHDYMVDLED